MPFVDTNVLIYAASPDPGEEDKQRKALELLTSADLTISVQVLQEFYHQTTRPGRPSPLAPAISLEFLDSLDHIKVISVTQDIFRAGAAISRRHQVSYWDGAIVAAAKSAGCDEVYTEDLNHGQSYDGVVAINPFQ